MYEVRTHGHFHMMVAQFGSRLQQIQPYGALGLCRVEETRGVVSSQLEEEKVHEKKTENEDEEAELVSQLVL